MPNQLYTEEEIAELLRRAAELQAASGRMHGSGTGLTLDELATIAADSGLDPEFVRTAAAELKAGVRPRALPTRTSTREIVVERMVPHTASPDAIEDIIAQLRHQFELGSTVDYSQWGMGSYGKGQIQTVGRSTEWQFVNPWWGTQTRVLIQPRDEATRIRITRSNSYSGAASSWHPMYALFFAAGPGLLAGLGAGSLWMGFVVALLSLAVVVPLIMRLGRNAVAKQERELESLADDLSALVAPVSVAPPSSVSQRSVEPQIPLDWDQDSESNKASPSARRRVSGR
jgi:hypothetical protein